MPDPLSPESLLRAVREGDLFAAEALARDARRRDSPTSALLGAALDAPSPTSVAERWRQLLRVVPEHLDEATAAVVEALLTRWPARARSADAVLIRACLSQQRPPGAQLARSWDLTSRPLSPVLAARLAATLRAAPPVRLSLADVVVERESVALLTAPAVLERVETLALDGLQGDAAEPFWSSGPLPQLEALSWRRGRGLPLAQLAALAPNIESCTLDHTSFEPSALLDLVRAAPRLRALSLTETPIYTDEIEAITRAHPMVRLTLDELWLETEGWPRRSVVAWARSSISASLGIRSTSKGSSRCWRCSGTRR